MNRNGFSLLEVMVVVAIMVVTAMLAIPNFMNWVSNQRLRDDVFQLEGDVQVARMTAMQRGTTVAFALNSPGADQYKVFIDDGENPGAGGVARDMIQNGDEALLFERTLQSRISFGTIDFGGGESFLFNGRGFRSIPTGGNAFVDIKSDTGREYRITLNLVGDTDVSGK